MNKESHPFNRCGIAALSDLETPEWRELFQILERDQSEFARHAASFRSAEYKWPHDPLHTWSRIWEYPYVYHHLRDQKSLSTEKNPRLVDVGSGVTFFPFSVARLGYEVICTDIDPVCERDLKRATAKIPAAPGSVSSVLTTGDKLPFASGSVDCVTCISVIEHVDHFESLFAEITRILKPHGRFILTIDLGMRGNSELTVLRHRLLSNLVTDAFNQAHRPTTTHPRNQLTSDSGPFPIQRSSLGRVKYFVRNFLPESWQGLCLACEGFYLSRKEY